MKNYLIISLAVSSLMLNACGKAGFKANKGANPIAVEKPKDPSLEDKAIALLEDARFSVNNDEGLRAMMESAIKGVSLERYDAERGADSNFELHVAEYEPKAEMDSLKCTLMSKYIDGVRLDYLSTKWTEIKNVEEIGTRFNSAKLRCVESDCSGIVMIFENKDITDSQVSSIRGATAVLLEAKDNKNGIVEYQPVVTTSDLFAKINQGAKEAQDSCLQAESASSAANQENATKNDQAEQNEQVRINALNEKSASEHAQGNTQDMVNTDLQAEQNEQVRIKALQEAEKARIQKRDEAIINTEKSRRADAKKRYEEQLALEEKQKADAEKPYTLFGVCVNPMRYVHGTCVTEEAKVETNDQVDSGPANPIEEIGDSAIEPISEEQAP